MGPLELEVLSFLLGEAKDILFLILFCRAKSTCLSFDFWINCFSFYLLSTEVRLVRAVPIELAFFLW